MVNKILFITLSNIGDAILALPALDALRQKFPRAKITVLTAGRPQEIFQDNPNVGAVILFDKRAPAKEQARLFNRLKRERFDLVVDLRNTFFGFLLGARAKNIPAGILHMRDRHLARSGLTVQKDTPKTLYIGRKEEDYIAKILQENKISDNDRIVVVASGARSHIKRWPREKFVDLISSVIEEFGVKVILAGDKDDTPVNKYIAENIKYPLVDLTAKTSLSELACLLEKAELLVTNDSAILHMAGYLDVPTVAIFGPTDEKKYGPWSGSFAVVKKELSCRPCSKAQCKFGHLQCMQFIKVDDVLRQVRDILVSSPRPAPSQDEGSPASSPAGEYKRILIVRTDRIGDVLLSTPVIKALRREYPHAYIAMMVGPYAKDIVEGNPYLDEVIIYDKDAKHKSWRRSIKFAQRLKKKKFDLAIVLHPTNRVHMVTFFAGIPRRVGYNYKLGFLLSDKLEHTKPMGQKHELEYNLDLLRHLGIESAENDLFMPVKKEAEAWVEELFRQEGIRSSDRILAIHPGASCPSKVWPSERFAEVADRLAEKHGLKVLLLAGPKDISVAEKVFRAMDQPVINLAGKTSVAQLASILKRCSLFISNDSGPVHIASALGVPVVSIFGRNQPGLGPRRWGPVGENSRVARGPVNCLECLAHNCVRGFICLKAVTVNYVLSLAEEILK